MKKNVSILMLCFIVLFANAKTGENDAKKTDVKQNSTFFKMSRNSNRLALFEQLQSVIKIKYHKVNTNFGSQTTGVQYSTYDDVVELLGEPNVKVKKTSIIYTLNPTIGCKAIIEFDVDGYVVYIGIKDCR